MSVIHMVLLLRAETWVFTDLMGKALVEFHNQVARRMTGHLPQRTKYGAWIYTSAAAEKEAAVFLKMEEYVRRQQNMVAQYITTQSQIDLCEGVGEVSPLLKYYRDMGDKRSHFLQPLTALTSKKVKFKWKIFGQKESGAIKRIFICDTLLIYPYLNKRFDIQPEARKLYLGAVISQTGKPLASYRLKLTKWQQQYIVKEKELFSIV